MNFKFNSKAIAALAGSQEVADMLGDHAEEIEGRVKKPSRMELFTRRGVNNRKQAYAQVIMRGNGALAIEFGTRRHAPKAPLRNALFS